MKARLVPYHKRNGESGLSGEKKLWFLLKEKMDMNNVIVATCDH